jgi:hypothetical protein
MKYEVKYHDSAKDMKTDLVEADAYGRCGKLFKFYKKEGGIYPEREYYDKLVEVYFIEDVIDIRQADE